MWSLLTNLRSNQLGLFLRHLSTSSDMLVAPPEVIASWPKPNYVNPEHQGPHLMIVVIGCFTISSVVVALRTYVRVKIKRNVGWDDWLMLSTLV